MASVWHSRGYAAFGIHLLVSARTRFSYHSASRRKVIKKATKGCIAHAPQRETPGGVLRRSLGRTDARVRLVAGNPPTSPPRAVSPPVPGFMEMQTVFAR